MTPKELHPRLKAARFYAFDFETTGLFPHLGAKPFCVSFAWREEAGIQTVSWLSLPTLDLSPFRAIFADSSLVACAHNAKFEGSFLHAAGIPIGNKVWDTEVFERVRQNNHMSYSLENCGKRLGFEKDMSVKTYMDKHKLYTKNSKGKKDYQFTKVPAEMIKIYCERDSEVSLLLCEAERETFLRWDETPQPIQKLVNLELVTTKNLLKMELHGIRVDSNYCQNALVHERTLLDKAHKDYQHLVGEELVDSAKNLKGVFDRFGLKYGETEKENDSFASWAIASNKHPIVDTILRIRDAEKRSVTYFENFIRLMTPAGRIHPSIRQPGTATGRFSCMEPNVQNWPDEKEEVAFPVRRAFLADPGCKIVSIDYSQMEYRVLLDEAEELGIINEINTKGIDIHQATANMLGISRTMAKTINFALLYGIGVKRLAENLSMSVKEAKQMKELYFDRLPKISRYIENLTRFVKNTGTGFNWIGRRYTFDRGFEYKYPNYRIQGGCADIFRIALDRCTKLLCNVEKAAILLPIHDELVFNLPTDRLDLIPELKRAMRLAFVTKRHIELDGTVSIGDNFFDLESYEETRD